MHSEDSDQTGHPPTAGWSESSLGSHANLMVLSWRGSNKGRVIFGNDTVEKFYVCFLCLHFMSAWVQVLDFTKSLVYSNCLNDRKCFFFFCFFRLCVMYAFFLSLKCLFIISGEFDALHKLSVKNRILWKYSIQSLKTADAVLLSLFMRDNGRCDIPHDA